MWIPKSEDEIVVAISNRSLEETVTFDAKREIPAKNIETAKDISALANTAGGVLLYGVDEDDTGYPTVLSPISLEGQRERIDQIVRTSVDEVPGFTISTIPIKADTTKGYLVVLVPPSDRAPHMVIVRGERRFYSRGETGNYVLSQAEVARLYERRQQLLTSTISSLLEQFVCAPPISANEQFAHLHIVVRPVLSDDCLLAKAQKPGETARVLLSNLVVAVRGDNSLGTGDYSPDFNPPLSGWTRHPEAYVGKLSSADPTDPTPDRYALQLTVNLDASAYLFCGRAAETYEGEKYFLTSVVEGNASRLLGMLGRLFERASYLGMVDMGLAITGLQGCVNYESRVLRSKPHRYDGPDYRKTLRTSAKTLAETPKETALQLLTPLLEALK
jgi:hypothetical protein